MDAAALHRPPTKRKSVLATCVRIVEVERRNTGPWERPCPLRIPITARS
jgi:hypothetical protein